MEREDRSPANAASANDGTLEVRNAFTLDSIQQLILGLGEDGHTCSMVPGSTALVERNRLYVETWVPQQGSWRTTVTFRLLHSARRLVFLVSGSAKAPEVARILDESPDERSPAWLASRGKGETILLLHRAAASALV